MLCLAGLWARKFSQIDVSMLWAIRANHMTMKNTKSSPLEVTSAKSLDGKTLTITAVMRVSNKAIEEARSLGLRSNANEAFAGRLAHSRELLRLLTAHVDANMGVGPERVNWGHAGDAGKLLDDLREICRSLILK